MADTPPTPPAAPAESGGDTPKVIADEGSLAGMLPPELQTRPAPITVTLSVTMTRPAYGAWTQVRAARIVMLLATYALRLRHVQHVTIETATVEGREISTPDGTLALHPDPGSETS